MADAAAALQAQITAAVTAALAAAAPVAHVAVKLPDFWVKDPKMWFSQQCCGSGSGRIRNFLPDPDPESDPE